MRKGLENVLERRVKKSGNYHYEDTNFSAYEVFYHTTCIAGYSPDDGIGFADNRGLTPLPLTVQ